MIHFNYKNTKYSIFFYPCGFMARVTREDTGRARDFRFNKNTTIKSFLAVLDKVQF